MSQSSPEGIILGKGSTLESFSLSINKEKVLELKQQERSYSEEEVVNILIKAYEDIGKRKIPNQVVLAKWFEQFKRKNYETR